MNFLRFLLWLITGRPPTPRPRRIQLRRSKGWRMPENCVKVDRSTRWGNPFKAGPQMSPEAVTRLYETWIRSELNFDMEKIIGHQGAMPDERMRPTISEIRRELRGKHLGCWCPIGAPCHADVLLKISNG